MCVCERERWGMPWKQSIWVPMSHMTMTARRVEKHGWVGSWLGSCNWVLSLLSSSSGTDKELGVWER